MGGMSGGRERVGTWALWAGLVCWRIGSRSPTNQVGQHMALKECHVRL